MSRIDTMARFEEPSIYDEPKVVSECSECGNDLCEGEEVVEYDGEHFCDKYCLIDYIDINIVEL